ncbi:MAG: hypothetical protein LQ343_002413 [Gyalolechia ehrenbergii]|nr:MAG: hypothetical protein LQ343_002413 [Gyalolechia ehrenbergii]
MAANKWNETSIAVKFEYVAVAKDAHFVVCHGGDKGKRPRQHLLPEPDRHLLCLRLYIRFNPGWKEKLRKVFIHELGHVLGLRHEFAMKPGDMFEGDAVQVGQSNELSVMHYRKEPPELQRSDVTSTRESMGCRREQRSLETPIEDCVPM